MRSISHLIKFFLLDQIRGLCPAKGWRSRAGQPPSPEPAGFSLPGWMQNLEERLTQHLGGCSEELETFGYVVREENASFTDGDPRATQLTCPTRWVAEGREGLDETSRVVFQLFASFMASLLQFVPNSRPGPGSHKSLPH